MIKAIMKPIKIIRMILKVGREDKKELEGANMIKVCTMHV
jgi:hypothetical protein